ncbi:MAG: hypothetical protein IJF76_03265 [Clostridia bacterium]|nr:hypothetical protein [Clostridia bacterium]
MRKALCTILIIALLVSCCFSLFACGEQEYDYLIAGGTLLCDGECVVTLVLSNEYSLHYDDFVMTNILPDVSVDDIVLDGRVAGKKIEKVEWVSAQEIAITFSGTIEKPEPREFSHIKIKGSAMENGITYSAVLSSDQFIVPHLTALMPHAPSVGVCTLTVNVLPVYCDFSENFDASMVGVGVVCSELSIEKITNKNVKITLTTDTTTWGEEGLYFIFSADAVTTGEEMKVYVD